MNQIKLADTVKDQTFEGFLIVKSASKRTNKNGDPYLDINLADDSQEMNGKVWNSNEPAPPSGAVMKVRAVITEYNGRLQLKIEKMRASVPSDMVDLSQLVKAAPRPADTMFKEIMDIVSAMQNPVLKSLTAELLNRAAEKIQYYPAAQSMHHAERSGLLHHLTDMLQAARAICACYPYLDVDLVLSGVIVHDLGKLTEMDANALGVVNEYTKEGLLLGHIVTGVSDLRDAAKSLGMNPDDEYPLLLSHMVLSHHGIPEYGSPRMPMFPEAEVLNWLDVLDSRLYEMREAQLRTRQGGFSDKVFALDRRVYHPVYANEAPDEIMPDTPFSLDEEQEKALEKDFRAGKRISDEQEYNRFL